MLSQRTLKSIFNWKHKTKAFVRFFFCLLNTRPRFINGLMFNFLFYEWIKLIWSDLPKLSPDFCVNAGYARCLWMNSYSTHKLEHHSFNNLSDDMIQSAPQARAPSLQSSRPVTLATGFAASQPTVGSPHHRHEANGWRESDEGLVESHSLGMCDWSEDGSKTPFTRASSWSIYTAAIS